MDAHPSRRGSYILKETMGADGELERRGAELADLRRRGIDVSSFTAASWAEAPPEPPSSASGDGEWHDGVWWRKHARGESEASSGGGEGRDTDDAVACFSASVGPGGWMRELISCGELGVLIGETLFVHGGLIGSDFGGDDDDDAYGHVPGRAERLTDPVAWLRELSIWKMRQVDEWIRQPAWSHASSAEGPPPARGGEGLLDYVIRGTGPTVVMGRHLSSDGMPRDVPDGLLARLERARISRLIVGHTPVGNCPTVIKTKPTGKVAAADGAEGGLEVIMNDTSYSDMRAPDNRGQAVTDLVLYPSADVRITGRLEDGNAIDYSLGRGIGPPDELVGQLERSMLAPRSETGEALVRFVKARMEAGDYLLCRVNGFKVDYTYLSEVEAFTAVGAVAAHDAMRATVQSHAVLGGNPRALGSQKRSSLRIREIGASLGASADGLRSAKERTYSTKRAKCEPSADGRESYSEL